MLCGDFNRLNISRWASQFKLKQLVDKVTRGDRTLDLVITNLASLYDKNSVEILPPFVLSDHNAVVLRPKARVHPRTGASRKLVPRRDTRDSKKRELGRYFNSIDWSVLESANCEDQARLFEDLVNIGLDIIMLVKFSKLYVNDHPWVTPKFKSLRPCGCGFGLEGFHEAVPCLVVGSIYHPQFVDDKAMLEYLSSSLSVIEGFHPAPALA